MKKRQKPRKSKRSPHVVSLPPAKAEKVKSTEEREAGTPEVPGGVECEWEELPEIDEETKVVLLPVNPYLVHVYWGLAAHDLEKIERVFRRLGARAQPVLRFYDIGAVSFDGAYACGGFEVEVDLRAKNWYVHLKSPAKSYRVDLGLRTAGGGFHRLARSNATEIPRAWPSDEVEESYLLFEGYLPGTETVVPPGAKAERVKSAAEPLTAGEPRDGEEKRAEPQVSGFFHTAVPREMERKLVNLYQRERWEWPGWAPAPGSEGDPQPPGKEPADLTEVSERSFRKERADLTEVSERSFRAGLPSSPKSSVVSRQLPVKAVSED